MSIIISIRLKQEHKDFFKDKDINVSEYINRLLDKELNSIDYYNKEINKKEIEISQLKEKVKLIEYKRELLLKGLDEIEIRKIKDIKNNLKLNNVKLINCYRYFINNHRYIDYPSFIDLLTFI